MSKVPQPSEELVDLLFFALDHGISSVDGGGGPLIPFVIVETKGKRSLRRFVTDRLEEGVALARREARLAVSTADRAAVAWDGFLRSEQGDRVDAILVAGSEGHAGPTFTFAQRYRVEGRAKSVRPVGNTAYVDFSELLFPE